MNLGPVHEKKSDYEKALEYYKLSLDITIQVLGREHTDGPDSHLNIDVVYWEKKKWDKMAECFLRGCPSIRPL